MKRLILTCVTLIAALMMAACDASANPDNDTMDSFGNEDDTTIDDPEPVDVDALTVDEVLGTRLYFPDATDIDGIETVVIEDLLLNLDGEIMYVVIDTGALIDFTGETYAIGRETIVTETVDGEAVLTTTTTVSDLETFPEFDLAAIGDGVAIDDEDPANDQYNGLLRASRYTDFDLDNGEGEDLGEVENLIVSVSGNDIAYAVADIGGFLGVGERTVAIPFERFVYDIAEDKFVVMATQAELEEAPPIDLNDWDALEGLEADIVDYWNDLTE